MFVINEEDNSIYITRGDVAFFSVSSETEDGEAFKFHPGDVVRFKVFGKKNCENVVLSKDFGIEEETEEALIYLEEKDTKIGDVISKPVDYWYEVELNPYTDPQTIIGYDDEDGAKIFRLFPEGAEAEDDVPVTPEDIPVVDEELDLTSTRPVQNQAIARAILKTKEDVKAELESHSEEIDETLSEHSDEIEGKCQEVKESLAWLKVENISDDFLTEEVYRCTVDEVTVFKQGNIISGCIGVSNISSSGCTLRINENYFSLHNVISRGFAKDSSNNYVEEGCTAGLGSLSNILDVMADGSTSALFSFTYICREL